MKKFLIISILIVFLDQLIKAITTNIHKGIINYAENTGAAFSLFHGYTEILTLISILVAILVFLIAKKERKIEIPLAFIFGGTIGNLIDRLFFGYVRDFIDLKIWPIFNIADSFNVIGIAIIIYLILNKKV